jgi:hypothetical protein
MWLSLRFGEESFPGQDDASAALAHLVVLMEEGLQVIYWPEGFEYEWLETATCSPRGDDACVLCIGKCHASDVSVSCCGGMIGLAAQHIRLSHCFIACAGPSIESIEYKGCPVNIWNV